MFAGVLKISGEGADKLRNRNLSNLHVLQLNVNSTTDIKEAVSTVKTIAETQGKSDFDNIFFTIVNLGVCIITCL